MNDKNNTNHDNTEENFEELLKQSYTKQPARMEPGQKIEAAIVKITPEWTFLGVGGKGEGCIESKELQDAEGKFYVKEGDMIRAYFLRTEEGEMRFTTRIGSGPAARAMLEDACREHHPVEGTVSREISGGFEVTLNGGARAFCPFSHMGLRRGENKADYVGAAMSFHVIECTGRSTLLSRREMVEAERKEKAEALKAALSEGDRVKGVVTSIQKFGAFVDIGGIEGLLPVSELAWERTEKVSDRLSSGQPVEVIIKNLDWPNGKISLSLKDTLPNPWDSAAENFPPGSYHKGKVSRLAPFGAFVSLAPGVDGLVHVSRLSSERRVQHPEEVLSVGQELEVKIERVDRASGRISLIPADISRQEEETTATMKRYQAPDKHEEKPMGSLGEMLKMQLEKKAKIQGK